MKKLFSTADVHRRDRFDYWHNVACENLVDHASKPECRQTFEAKIETERWPTSNLSCSRTRP